MRGIMEAPFPAPGRTITVKNFLPGSGTEVRKTLVSLYLSCHAHLLAHHLPWTHISSLSSCRWSNCVDRQITVWNTWTLNVSSPPLVCVCYYGCLRLSCWSAGSSSLLTSSGWRLIWRSYLTTRNESFASPRRLIRVCLWCECSPIQTKANCQGEKSTKYKYKVPVLFTNWENTLIKIQKRIKTMQE